MLCDIHTFSFKITLQRTGPLHTVCHGMCVINSGVFCLLCTSFLALGSITYVTSARPEATWRESECLGVGPSSTTHFLCTSQESL